MLSFESIVAQRGLPVQGVSPCGGRAELSHRGDIDINRGSQRYSQVSRVVVVRKWSRSARQGAGVVFSGSMAVYWPR